MFLFFSYVLLNLTSSKVVDIYFLIKYSINLYFAHTTGFIIFPVETFFIIKKHSLLNKMFKTSRLHPNANQSYGC